MKPDKKHSSPVARLRQYRLIYHLLLIVLILAALAVGSHVAMQIGTRHGARRTVPDFTGVLLADAERVAAENDLELHINDSLFVPAYEGGIVLDQLPESGVEVKPGRTVYITINSFRQKMVPVPYVAGRSLRQAKNMLEIAGLEIDRLIYRPDIATNYVLEEYLDEVKITDESVVQAEMGSGLTLYVGVEEDKNLTAVPQVVGLSLQAAKGRVWESGLNVGKVVYDEGINLLNQKNARVYMQLPTAEQAATLGGKVELRLTLDEEKVAREKAAAEKMARELLKQRAEEAEMEADSLARAALEQRLNATLNRAEEQTSADVSNDDFFE